MTFLTNSYFISFGKMNLERKSVTGWACRFSDATDLWEFLWKSGSESAMKKTKKQSNMRMVKYAVQHCQDNWSKFRRQWHGALRLHYAFHL